MTKETFYYLSGVSVMLVNRLFHFSAAATIVGVACAVAWVQYRTSRKGGAL